MTHTRSADSAAAGPAPTLSDREAMVRTAAYFRYVNNGCRAGHDAEDWFAAETEIDALFAVESADPAPAQPVRRRAKPARSGR